MDCIALHIANTHELLESKAVDLSLTLLVLLLIHPLIIGFAKEINNKKKGKPPRKKNKTAIRFFKPKKKQNKKKQI